MINPKTVKTITWKFRDIEEGYPEIAAADKIHNTIDLFTQFKFIFHNEVRERFVVFWLNQQNKVMGYEVITEGLLSLNVVHPREVFRGAIVATCKSIIIAHNHPSGNPEPSEDDIAVTKQVVEAGKIIGIPVLDHVIFTNDKYTSFRERGLI